MRRAVHSILFIVIMLSFVFAGDSFAGKTRGLSTLRVGIGGRAVGMGEAFTAVSTGALAAFWNPAGLIESETNELVTAHNRWLFDVSSEFVSYAVGREKYAFGFSFYYADMGELEARTYRNEAQPIGIFGAHDLYLGFSYAQKLDERLDIGITMKYVYEKIYVESSSGYAFDIGARYNVIDNKLKAGAVLKNLGTMNEMRNERLSLPTVLRTGIMYDVSSYLNRSDFLIFSADFEMAAGYDDHLMIGSECRVYPSLLLRGGYQMGYDERNICGGIGIIYGFVNVDYGFTPFSNDLGSTHRFSIKFVW